MKSFMINAGAAVAEIAGCFAFWEIGRAHG